MRGNGSTSDYHSLQVQFTRRLSRGLQALASYTWSHAIDSGSADLDRTVPGSLVSNTIDRGSSDFDVRHAFSGAVTYNIPTPKWGTAAEAVLRNWSFNSVFFARTATPFTVIADQATEHHLVPRDVYPSPGFDFRRAALHRGFNCAGRQARQSGGFRVSRSDQGAGHGGTQHAFRFRSVAGRYRIAPAIQPD